MENSQFPVSIVVPIHRIPSDLESILRWLPNAPADFQIIIAHDIQRDLLLRKDKNRIMNSHPNLILLENRFGGPGGARNAGIEHASGKYIAFWDSDDFPLVKNFIEMTDLIDELGAECIFGGYIKRNSITGLEKRFIPQKDNWVFQTSIEPGLWRFLIRRNVLQGVQPDASRI
jgi:glycosyltransferase involved in cell wall biosynthesis